MQTFPRAASKWENLLRGRYLLYTFLEFRRQLFAPRYAGYALSAYANSIAQRISKKERKIQNFNSVLLIAISFMREEFESVRSTKKETGTHKECLLILLGAYRFSGILPGEEIKSAVDKKRNVICKLFPERQASGRIRGAGDICYIRSLNSADSFLLRATRDMR